MHIHSFFKYLKPFTILLYVASIVLLLSSIPHRMIHIDDAWLGEYAYWLNKTGVVKSEFFRGFQSYETQLLVYHKLFIWLGAQVISTFGFDVFHLKSISLVFFALANIIIYAITKRMNFSLPQSLFALLLFCIHPLVFEMAFVYRPELMVTAIGLASYFFISSHFNKPNIAYVAIAGLLAGLCAFTHLNGLIYIVAGGVLLLINKQVMHTFIFGISSALTSSLYFYDVFVSNKWSLFLQQFKNDPALRSEDFTWYNPIVNFLKEHERFFHSPIEIFFSVLVIFSIICAYRYIITHHRNLFLYTLLLIVTLALVAHGKTTKYMIYYIPFLAVITVVGFESLITQEKFSTKWKSLSATMFLGLFIIHSVYYNFSSINNMDFQSLNSQIAKHIPSGSRVIAPMRFIYNEIPNYRIMSFEKYEVLAEKNPAVYKNFNFFTEAKRNNIEYVIFSGYHYEKFVFNQSLVHDTSGYKYVAEVGDFKIFRIGD